MIVLSDDDRRQLKSPAVPLPALRTPHQLHGTTSPSGSSVHLPDYEASQLEANVLPRPVSDTSIPGETSLTRSRRRKWARLDGRLWKAVCYAFGFYVLLTVILGVPFIVSLTQRFTSMLRARTLPWAEGDPNTSPSQTPLDDTIIPEIHQCDNWTEVDNAGSDRYRARISALLSPVGVFELLSNSSIDNHHSFGNLTIGLNDDLRATQTTLTVDVVAPNHASRQRANVCLYSSPTGHRLKLFLPTGREVHSEETLQFDIKLLFPQSVGPVRVKKLITYLPSFTQRLGNLSQFISFDKVSLTGAGREVEANSLFSKKVFIKNTEAPVLGTFNISEELIIDNYEGPIHANATLFRGKKKGPPVTASLDTGNSSIEATFTLQAVSSNSFIPLSYLSPAYSIDLKTFNAPIVSSILHHPSTSPTPPRIRVQNHVAPSTITVDTKYLGSFDVQSKLSSAHVEEADSISSTFVYEHRSTSRTYGRVGVESHCVIATTEITSSREPARLLFVEAEK